MRYLGLLPFYYPTRQLTDIIPAPPLPETGVSPSMVNPYQRPIEVELTSLIPDIDFMDNSAPIPNPPETHQPQTRQFHQTTLNNGCWDDFQVTCDRIQKNEAWGDKIIVKNDNIVCLYFQNLTSCGLSQGTTKWDNILSGMIISECDIMNFVQTSANWTLLHIRNNMHAPICKHMPTHNLIVGRNKFQSLQPALPRGTAQMIQGDWTGRFNYTLQDTRNMGRWCGTKMRLKYDQNLYIITAS